MLFESKKVIIIVVAKRLLQMCQLSADVLNRMFRTAQPVSAWRLWYCM